MIKTSSSALVQSSSSYKRRGEANGWIILLMAGAAIWFFVIRPGGGPSAVQPTRPVLADTRYDYDPFDDSSMIATVRNVGGAGRVKVEVKAYRDQQCTKFIDNWSTVVYLQAGEEQRVTIRLRGLKEGSGTYTLTTATAE